VFYLGFARREVKRNVFFSFHASTGNIILCCGKHVAHELQVWQVYSTPSNGWQTVNNGLQSMWKKAVMA
jgi:hypothetical protein